jgi:hypothetical protein
MCIFGSGVIGATPFIYNKGFYCGWYCLLNRSLSPHAMSYFKSHASGIVGFIDWKVPEIDDGI